MSSLLNLSLRERNGLVYTVESNATCYTDSGVWTTYFGCDPEDVRKCCRLVERELRKLTDKPLSQQKLNAARQQLKGQIAVSYDNFESLAISMAKRYLHYGSTQTMQQLFNRLDELTPTQLWETAQEAFSPQNLHTLIYK
jgi:predicted Zn-dependent peptidase